jgi:CubicO group peptidase (beta-lactamase class C family)
VQLDRDVVQAKVGHVFTENFEHFGELGAAVSVWQHGQPVLELVGGFRDAHRSQQWTDDTLVLVWSATKGIGSACLLHALREAKLPLSRRVSEIWPEFNQANKGPITIGQLMSHSAGLCALETTVDVLDYPAVIRALEQQPPLWIPGSAHGYHARTFGFLIDELNRRITGLPISQYWAQNFAGPLGLDFWIGLPNELNHRVATIYPGQAGKPPEPAEFYRKLTTPGTLQRLVFNSPGGLQSISAMNRPEIRAQPVVSFGGIGSASALAKFYSLLGTGGEWQSRRYFDHQTLRHAESIRQQGIDRVFEIPTAFSAGFMKDPSFAQRRIFGPEPSAFGHPGAGGCHAFADPKNAIGFAYVMNQMEQSVLPSAKALRLVAAVYSDGGERFETGESAEIGS